MKNFDKWFKKRHPDVYENAWAGDQKDTYFMHEMKAAWRNGHRSVPDGFVLAPLEPTEKQWGALSRHLCRYQQTHSRYCPKTLKKYFDRFIGDVPEWLNREVPDWNSDHAFATADLGVFVYKAMLEELK